MAALLRSARLLKFSPSGLLQTAGTRRTGPLYSRIDVWPYAVGCVRSYAVVTEQKDEPSVMVRSKQAQQFDWALAKMDSSVRRTGRITKTLLLRIFHDFCRTGYPSGNQALLLLRSCGSLLPEVPLEERTELAHRVWQKLQELGAHHDVSHYNALLKVYLQNEFKFSPTDFLAKMEAANVQPNRVTYQRLIAAYCQNGDIEGASTILGFMKSKDLPITEVVFSSLVTGHARAGDIESAKNILSVMQGAGIEPGPDTYVALLKAYAEKGDFDSLKKTLEAAESADCSLMDRDLMQVIFALAKTGHQQHVPEIIQRLRHESGYIPDAMNLCLSLITQGQEDIAFEVLKNFPVLQSDGLNGDSPSLGNFFLRHCANMETKICSYCQQLQELNLHTAPLSFTLSCALGANKTAMSLELMKIMKEQDLPIRPHYFWPLLTQHVKENNTAELVKGMHQLGVSPDVETLSNYILPVFSSMEAARQTLKVIHKSVKREKGEAVTASRHTFTHTSALKQPLSAEKKKHKLTLQRLQKNSINAQMDAVTDTVANGIYSESTAHDMCVFFSHPEVTSYFLYNLIDSMSEGEVQAQEDKLRKYFNRLKTQNITISVNICRGIRNLLESHHVPELIKDVIALVESKDQGSEVKVLALENKLAELKAENKPLDSVLKHTIQSLCAEENLQHALELKQQYEEEMTAGGYATLISLCCRLDNVEEALNLKREMSRKDSSVALDASKYITLIKALSKHGRVEVDILKEMKEKEVVISDSHVTMLFHTLNSLVAEGSATTIQKLQDTIFTLGLAKPSANLCSPLVTVHLESKDLSGALEAAIECQKRYKHLPRLHDIIVGLVEKGDTEQLQKAMDFVSQERGEMTMLYNLFFAFLQTGRYREARKIIETPGLRARPGRLQWFAEKCISANQMEALEQMVDMTAKLFECDRDEMYNYVLRLCKETNDWQKAETMWTKMQEENVIPRERTLRMLAEILKNNGQEVPFEVSEVNKGIISFFFPTSCPICFLFLFPNSTLSTEAYGMLKEADKKGVALGPAHYDQLIRALLAKGSIEDAMVKLKSMLKTDQMPSQLAVTRLVQALGNHGEVAGIEEVESQMKGLGMTLNLSSMLFVSNKALAHIKNGDVESAVEVLEAVYTSPDNTGPSMAFVFRKVLEDGNDKALDKLSAMAERLANHFACYRPASDLFLQLLDMDKVEEAKFMLARCNAVAEQRNVLVSYMSKKAQSPGQVKQDFFCLFHFFPFSLSPYNLAVLDKDLVSAKALYEQMQKEGVVVDELSLKRLAVLYREAGEPVPFPEPPVSCCKDRRRKRDKGREAAALFTKCQES
uniref:Leucine rich pentatricopeptide repeat containing n=1 Tax=Mastacembelus armatus TaxID=205130 RepID=A0A3Q3MX86_9TELE